MTRTIVFLLAIWGIIVSFHAKGIDKNYYYNNVSKTQNSTEINESNPLHLKDSLGLNHCGTDVPCENGHCLLHCHSLHFFSMSVNALEFILNKNTDQKLKLSWYYVNFYQPPLLDHSVRPPIIG